MATIVRAIAVALVFMFCGPVNAQIGSWKLETKADPFTGKRTATMSIMPDGYALAMSVSCETHGYLAITLILRQQKDSWDDPTGTRRLSVKVDDGDMRAFEAEMYGTISNSVAIRTSRSDAPQVMEVLKEVEVARRQLAMRIDGLVGFTSASVRGSTKAAQTVRSLCGSTATEPQSVQLPKPAIAPPARTEPSSPSVSPPLRAVVQPTTQSVTPQTTQQTQQTVVATSELSLTPDQLQTRVAANGIRLQQEVRERGVHTSGTVHGVEEGSTPKGVRVPMIKIRSTNKFLQVHAHLKPQFVAAAARLDPDDNVSVYCRDIQLLSGNLVWLHECEIVEPKAVK